MKLDTKDLQFEHMNPFDGTMAYAQNKRQQVIMAEKWAEKHKEVFFSSMHPGRVLIFCQYSLGLGQPCFNFKFHTNYLKVLHLCGNVIYINCSASGVSTVLFVFRKYLFLPHRRH